MNNRLNDASCRLALTAILKRAARSEWIVCDEVRRVTGLTDEQIAALVSGPLVDISSDIACEPGDVLARQETP